jgi:hypothetical protein
MAVPKFQLNLDEEIDDANSNSIADLSIADHVEDEKCVVAQYRTTKHQKLTFTKHLENCDRSEIPIEWVIDIADESNGWFYATAYHFDDINQTLHVMVPDKQNPTFDGNVQLDYRTIHLIECVDGKTDALFNKIVRDSVLKIKWDLEWFEEDESKEKQVEVTGRWVQSTARYYIRIANQLLVEDKELQEDSDNQGTKGFVIITADLNVKLLQCHKNRGVEDFYRLIQEGIVQSSEDALVDLDQNVPSNIQAINEIPTTSDDKLLQDKVVNLQKITDLSHNIREYAEHLSFIREDLMNEEANIRSLWSAFILNGELNDGMRLMEMLGSSDGSNAAPLNKFQNLNEEITISSQKLEKYASKLKKLNNNEDTIVF